ncbi:unnamed protein product [Acanthoscelides obtectus]|uniref:Kinesin motor domain-containing protein n=1 Tax=Acanthoscelides obtectus TaxID=200917 RepID=A0A9P0QHW9_ACAOB|nr:unnamed protein product [Acanthoscelides obtectus]CAK1683979.1 Centromere-associated protein E [Acanthoscelides obtectus]
MENMMQGNKIRRVAATRMNERSSRSHTIFRIILESKDANQKDGPVHISYLNLMDLAGSERVSLTKAAGERLKEGANINKSLSVLGNVIRQLSEGKEFISYRDSKLTRLLSQALGDVYGSVVKPLVDSFMEGFNATIFAYGQTSSGKTHTILGNKTDPGLFQLVSNQLFQHVADQVDKRYLIRCSYIEIYNEKINDLLDKSNQGLTIREDIKGNVLLDAREAVVDNVDKVMENMMQGNKIRRVAATRMNERSSRSHTIFRIILESKDANQKDGPVHISYLNLMDLAGSERVSLTKAAGERLKEGANINKSLSVLGNVIRQLSEGKEFISYRDSKLTRLLSQALGGNVLLDAREAVVDNVDKVMENMMQGNKIRRVAATRMNERSSRSHTIFRIILESKDANQKDGPVHISYLNLMDLAGSERVSLTKAAGERLKEGANINKSLSVLGNVIRQLSEGKEFISYRDSKLTRLLSQALGDVYGSVVKPLVDSFMEGFNATIFAYGQTSSGKTHTILGNKTDPGLFQLVSNQLFQHVADQVDKRYLIRCSYIEIYNEKINDLLDKSNQGLTIREDIKGNVLLDAREAVVDNVDKVMENMMQGNKIRRVAATRMNERSSRSHTIFRIILESKDANQKDGPVHISYLNLMDLAGSERVSLTKAAGERLKEGANINKSLSVLGNVIRQLSEGKEFISYRDSKLTRLLSQALGGNAKSLIIGNVTLAAEEETRSTPEFAQSTKTVKNKTKVNILSATEETLQGYQNLTRDLETRLKKQAIKLKEMDKSKQEYLLEIERLKTEVSIVGRFQMGASASTPKKTLRRHTFGHYGNVSPKKASLGYMPLKNYPPKEESSGREMRPIQEETYEEALAEAESVIAEDVQVYLKDNKELEESFNELREFTKLDNQLEILDLKKQLTEANSKFDRYSQELRQVTDAYNEEIERVQKNSQKAQEFHRLAIQTRFSGKK